jgi:tetratricopeptide (TPR) repeat protein
VLEALGDVDADALLDALEEAERAGLVIAQQAKRETRYAFAHELIRQTLLGTLSVPRRLRRHLRTAEAMEKLYAGKLEQHASELAYHFFQSGSTQNEEKTTRYLLLAGDQALAAGAFDEALALAEKAFSIIESKDDRRDADLLWVKGSALRGLGKWLDARGAYLQALDRYEALGAQKELSQLTFMLAEMLYSASDHSQMVTITTRALRGTDETPSTGLARLLALGGNALALSGDYREGIAMSDRALAMTSATGDQETRGHVLMERANILVNFGYFASAAPLAAEAHTLLVKGGKRWSALWSAARVAWIHSFAGRPREVVSMSDDLLREAAEIGHVGAKLVVDLSVVSARWTLDPHVDLLSSAARALAAEYAADGITPAPSDLYAALDHFERDDHVDPDVLLKGAADQQSMESWRDNYWSYYFVLSAHTHPARALAILDANAAALPAPGQPAFVGAWNALGAVLVGLVRLGERTRAAALYPHCLERVGMGFVSGALFGGLAETVAGIAAASGERWEDAERHFNVALRVANEMPHVPAQADTRYWHAWMLLQRRAPGDAERARTLLDEAIPMFERSGRKRRMRESGELIQSI